MTLLVVALWVSTCHITCTAETTVPNFGCSSFDNLPSVNNYGVHHVFPQQRKLMGSSAQNSSGVHWCRRRVRFNEVPEKVPKVPEQVWEALVQSQVRFNGVPEKVPEKVPGSLGAKQSPVQQGFGEGSKVPVWRFGAEPGQVQEGRERFRRRSGRLWCRAGSSSTGFRRRFWRRSGRLWLRARSVEQFQ